MIKDYNCKLLPNKKSLKLHRERKERLHLLLKKTAK
jgi:hypothetical protein